MGTKVARSFIVFALLLCGPIYTETLLLINVCASHGDSDRKNRNIHHEHIRDLDSRMELGKINRGKACRTCTSSLKQGIQHSVARRANTGNDGVIELGPNQLWRYVWAEDSTHIKYDEENHVKSVQYYKNPEEPPRCRCRKEECEAASWMIKQEFEFLPNTTVVGYYVRKDVDHESKHARESSIADDNKERSK